MRGNLTLTTTSLTEAQFRVCSLSNAHMSAPVTSLISESTSPSLLPKQPTKSDATKSLAITRLPSLKPGTNPFSATASIILANRRTTAFCAGEQAASRSYKKLSQPQINDSTFIQNYSTSMRINGRASRNYGSMTNLPSRDDGHTLAGLG